MAKQKVYAVRKGRTPGVYYSWDDCKAQVDGYPGAEYKSFKSASEADAFIRGVDFSAVKKESAGTAKAPEVQPETPTTPFAFVDGSYNTETGVYGYGGFVCVDGKRHYIQGHGNDVEMASMRNVAGEIEGSLAAVKKAKELGLSKLSVYYDYAGIEQWATGGWKCNKSGTIAYRDFMRQAKADGIDIDFVKVKGHSGIEGNEIADSMAKSAVGISNKPLPRNIDVENEMQVDCEFA